MHPQNQLVMYMYIPHYRSQNPNQHCLLTSETNIASEPEILVVPKSFFLSILGQKGFGTQNWRLEKIERWKMKNITKGEYKNLCRGGPVDQISPIIC